MYIDRQIYLYGIQRDERYNYITIYYTKSIINDILKTIPYGVYVGELRWQITNGNNQTLHRLHFS